MHDPVLGTAGVTEMCAELMMVVWEAWSSDDAGRHEDKKGDGPGLSIQKRKSHRHLQEGGGFHGGGGT